MSGALVALLFQVVCEHANVPSLLERFAFASYIGSTAIVPAGAGSPAALFPFSSGAMPGDPLAGVIFTIAMDACLRYIRRVMPPSTVMAACADDVGLVVNSIDHVAFVDQALEKVAKASALQVNFKKCVVLPLFRYQTHGGADEAQLALLSRRVSSVAPRWAAASLANSATFLGVEVGPAVTLHEAWAGALRKAKNVARRILAAGLSTQVSAHLIATRAFTCLSYTAQFFPVCRAVLNWERKVANNVLRAPGSIGRMFYPHMMQVFAVRHTNLNAALSATLLRYSSRSAPIQQNLYAEMRRHLRVHGPIAALTNDEWWPQNWGTEPFCWTMCMASKGVLRGDLPPKLAVSVAKGFATVRQLQTSGPLPSRSIQKVFYEHINKAQEETATFVEHLKHRLKHIGGEFNENTIINKLLEKGSHSPKEQLAYARLLLNAWPTQTRLHFIGEEVKCRFGCLAPDAIHHYVDCAPMLGVIMQVDEGLRATPLLTLQARLLCRRLWAVAWSLYTAVCRTPSLASQPLPLQEAARVASLSHPSAHC